MENVFNTIRLLYVGDESISTELRIRTAISLMQLENVILQDDNEIVKEVFTEQILLYERFATAKYYLHNTFKHVIKYAWF